MGKVFRGEYEETGLSVAVKVISGNTGRRATQYFHREVQAQASLVHPGVVYLLDYGTVGAEAARASGDEFLAQSPYVAMELADWGTVGELLVEDWETVQTLLIQVLEILAFTHARGVIHRDLKPDNLLLFETGSDRGRVKLADFGLAHGLGTVSDRHEEELATFSGTPFYMPPEQIRGRWRSYGPWTDLYAVGCIAWELICGRPPFVANSAMAVTLKHCTAQRPELKPDFAVPKGVQQWIHRAMAIDPARRFRRAAHAIRALRALSDAGREVVFSRADERERRDIHLLAPTVLTETGQQATASEAETEVFTRRDVERELATTLVDLDSAQTLVAKTRQRTQYQSEKQTEIADQHDAVSIPRDWRHPEDEQLPLPLVNAGLSLFELRDIPFVDREQERDRIWSRLNEVYDNQALCVIFIDGEAGVGKSRLARWSVTRVHEAGAEVTARTVHTPGGLSSAGGIAGAVRRIFRAWKLSRSECYQRLVEHLPPLGKADDLHEHDARALTELVHPTAEDARDIDGPRYRFDNPEQKSVVLTRMLTRFAQRSPPVLWFDDLQWGTETLNLVEHLVSRRRRH